MLEPLRRLCGALRVDAAPRDERLVLADFAVAFGASATGSALHLERLSAGRPLFLHHADQARDDVAAFLDDNRVADADVLASNFLLVMQRGAADGGAVEENRFQLGNRCERAGAANLDSDRVEPSLRLLRRVFVGHGPAWRLGGRADALALGKTVQLNNRPVRVVVEAATHAVELVDGVEHFIHARAAPCVLRRAEANLAKHVEQVGLRVDRRAADDLAAAVQDDVERALGHERGVKLLERTGGGVSGIGEERLAGVGTFVVELLEAGARHNHLAAHLEHLRRVRLAKLVEPQGNAPNRAEVCGYIVTSNAIATGDAAGEQAILKTETDRNAVGLRLDEPLEQLTGQKFLDTINKLAHLLLRVRVIEAHHRHRVPNGLEAVNRLAADPLARGIRCAKLGMHRLESQQLAVKPVVLLVADRRLGLDIIRLVMPENLLRQHRMPLL